MPKTITELQTLDINYLSNEKYQELVESSEIDPNALYITPDEYVNWGNIFGQITDQEDLIEYIHTHSGTGTISSISINGVEQPISSEGDVDIPIKEDFGIIGIPFDAEGNIAPEAPDYYKYTIPEYIDWEHEIVSHYLSGEEIRHLVNNYNCYCCRLIFIWGGFLLGGVTRYAYWGDIDVARGGIEIPPLVNNNLEAVFFEYPERVSISLTASYSSSGSAIPLAEAIGHLKDLTPQVEAGTGIEVSTSGGLGYNGAPIYTVALAPQLILDCGTSVINV